MEATDRKHQEDEQWQDSQPIERVSSDHEGPHSTPSCSQHSRDHREAAGVRMEAMQWSRDEVIFIDETGFDKHIHRRRGRSKRGTLATYTQPNSAGTRVNVCAAVKPAVGLLSYRLLLTTWNQKEFAAFINQLLGLLHTTHYIVVDGVKWHYTQLVHDVFEEQPIRHYLKVLPPYSPHVNAIEYCFHVWKTEIKHTDQTRAPDIAAQIDKAATRITGQLVTRCLDHVFRYYAHCIDRKPLGAFEPIEQTEREQVEEQQSIAEQKSDV